MTIINPFSASGTNDVPSLRRAITNAFTSLTGSINQEQTIVKPGITLPNRAVVGQMVYLSEDTADNNIGFYGYNGTTWLRLDNN